MASVHQRAFALQGGADATSAALWPLSLDGLLLLATVGLLKPTGRVGRRARGTVRRALFLGTEGLVGGQHPQDGADQGGEVRLDGCSVGSHIRRAPVETACRRRWRPYGGLRKRSAQAPRRRPVPGDRADTRPGAARRGWTAHPPAGGGRQSHPCRRGGGRRGASGAGRR
ncbi:DUF2637 domain-containing protein [Streptomyces sp. NPDC058086]|uniref:DUF2637 domain-containing protein n=1 Tax=Streptomyces sp. NPDC058086 TaxID=3346334 RepID=UPI0036EBA7B8